MLEWWRFFVLKARRGFTKPVQESSVQDPSRPGAKDCNGGSEKRPQLFKRYKKSRDILYPLVAWSMSIVKVAGTWLVGQSIKPKVKVTKPENSYLDFDNLFFQPINFKKFSLFQWILKYFPPIKL